MSDAPQGQQSQQAPSAPAAPAPDTPPVGEIPPFMDDPDVPQVDPELIMSTLFGESKESASASSSGEQGGGNASGAQSDGGTPGVAAPSSGASGQQAPTPSGQAAQGAGGPTELAPFPGAGPSQPAAGAPQQPQSPGPAGAAPSASAPAAAPSALPPEVTLRMQNLEGQITALTAMLQQQQQQQQRPQAAPQGTGTQPGQQPGGDRSGVTDPSQQIINLAAPPDVVAAIFDDDQGRATAGVNHLISATATSAYRRVMQDVIPLIERHISNFAGSQEQRSEQEKIETDYYSAFPAHRDPLFKQLIGSEYQQLFAQSPGLTWNEQARNALGARVNLRLQQLGFNIAPGAPANGQSAGGQQQQQQVGEAGPVALATAAVTSEGRRADQPVPMLGSGTRPPADPGQGDANFIRRTLG